MTETVPNLVALPYQGIRCRELSCQTPLIMARTKRATTIPLERERVAFTDGDDERGLFVVVASETGPTALGLRAAREAGVAIPALVYRSHFAACVAADTFRRRR